MKIGSPQEPDLEIDEVSAWSGSLRPVRWMRRRNQRPTAKRSRVLRSPAKTR